MIEQGNVRRPLARSPRRLARHRVLDHADDGGDDSAGYTATDRLAEQLADVDAARRALKDRQQRGEKCATARAAERAGDRVAERAEVDILDRRAGGIAA